ncbi:MAG: hypothetical protein KAY37_04495 [Phycisphaerae bacterium]|nr:hypothetical protein [Phycisphaerae bacterium]
MTGTETQIVRIVAERRRTDAPTIARVMGVTLEYVKPKIQMLVKSGYLLEVEEGIYNIKVRGSKALLPFAHRGAPRAVCVANYP